MNPFGSQLNARYALAIVILITIIVIVTAYKKYIDYQNMRALLFINTLMAETRPEKMISLDPHNKMKKENFAFVYKVKPKKFKPELSDEDLMNLQ